MKKLNTVVLMLALAAVMGCTKNESTGETTAKPATSSASVAATTTTAATASTADAASTGVAECDSYLKTLEKYMNCDKVPQAARDAQKQSAQTMRASWNWNSLPEASRKAAQDAAKSGCASGESALKQSAKAIGCSVD